MEKNVYDQTRIELVNELLTAVGVERIDEKQYLTRNELITLLTWVRLTKEKVKGLEHAKH